MSKKKLPDVSANVDSDIEISPEIMADVTKDVSTIDSAMFNDTSSRNREQRREAIRSNMRRVIGKNPL